MPDIWVLFLCGLLICSLFWFKWKSDRRCRGSQVKEQNEMGVPSGPLAALLGSIWRPGGDYGRWWGWNPWWNAQAARLLSEKPASCMLVAWGLRVWDQTPTATEGKVFTGCRDQHGLQRVSSSPEDHRQPLAIRGMWMPDGCLSMWGFTKPQMTFGELAGTSFLKRNSKVWLHDCDVCNSISSGTKEQKNRINF